MCDSVLTLIKASSTQWWILLEHDQNGVDRTHDQVYILCKDCMLCQTHELNLDLVSLTSHVLPYQLV